MADTTMDGSALVDETWVHTPRGRLFVKTWDGAPSGGSGRAPMVLLHDSLGCVDLWRDFPERLARAAGRCVVAYDRLGFGRSDTYPGALGPGFVDEEATGGFAAVRDHLEIGDFLVFGHSVGGGMATVCAATYPRQCRALITQSAQAFVEERTLAGIREAQRMFAGEGQIDRLRRYHGDKAEWVLDAWVSTWLSEAFRHWTLDDALRGVYCPVLAIHGEHDEYGSVRHPERIASGTAGPAATHILSECGHVPHREQPEAVLAAVESFLAEHALTSAAQ